MRANENRGYANAPLTNGSRYIKDYTKAFSDNRATWQRSWETEIGTVVQNDFETVTRHYISDYLSVANRDILVTEDGIFVVRYVYDESGKRISAEFDYADGTARGAQNARGEYGENPASDIAVGDIGKVWYRTSLLNSALYAVDKDGETVVHMIYDAWGNPLIETYADANLSGLENLNNFTGYTWDETLGLYFAQNRFYDPSTHRFTQEDIIKDGGNWYVYCANSPLVYVDPEGEFGLLAATLIAAGVTAVLAGGVSAYQSYKATGKVDVKDAGKAAVGGAASVVAVDAAVATGGVGLGVATMAAEGIVGFGATLHGKKMGDTMTTMAAAGALAAVGGNVMGQAPVGVQTAISGVTTVVATDQTVKDAKAARVTLHDPKATKLEKAAAVYDVVVSAAAGTLSAISTVSGIKTISANAQQALVTDNYPKVQCEQSNGWKVGDPIDKLTAAGKEPWWSTVRARYWKNQAYYNAGEYSEQNLIRMRQGLAPKNLVTGESMELHHVHGRNIPNPHAENNLMRLWPSEHAQIDPHRFYTGPIPEVK